MYAPLDCRKVVVGARTGPPQRRHAVDGRLLELITVAVEECPDPSFDSVEIAMTTA